MCACSCLWGPEEDAEYPGVDLQVIEFLGMELKFSRKAKSSKY